MRFTPKPQRDFMAVIRDQAKCAMNGTQPIEGPVEVKLLAVYPWPKGLSPRKRSVPGADLKSSRPDLSNIAKLVEDSLNAIVYVDDSQIAAEHLWKKFGEHPGLIVEVRRLGAML